MSLAMQQVDRDTSRKEDCEWEEETDAQLRLQGRSRHTPHPSSDELIPKPLGCVYSGTICVLVASMTKWLSE